MNLSQNERRLKMSRSKKVNRIQGKHGSYRLCKCLGTGGNGKVYSAMIDDSHGLDTSIDYAIKILTIKGIKSRKEREKRVERFKQEIQTVVSIQDEIDGIVHIYDYSIEDSSPLSKLWYLMPRAKRYEYKIDLESSLADAVTMGEIIHKLHKRGLKHRDIKPENILIVNGKLSLSDFGLVCGDNCDCITDSGDIVGPNRIRPPELERIEDRKMIDLTKSDVYLFAKTIWIMITGIKRGFVGPYSRSDKQICLADNCHYICKTIEPLHELMEMATVDDWKKRPTIEECIGFLKKQLNICSGDCSSDEIRTLSFEEAAKRSVDLFEPDDKVYKDQSKIVEILQGLATISYVAIDDYGKEIILGQLVSVSVLNSDTVVMALRYQERQGTEFYKRSIYLKIKNVTITKELNCSIAIEPIHGPGMEMLSVNSTKELVANMMSDKIFINMDTKMTIRYNLLQ